MATRLYIHAASSAVAGTLPSTEQSSRTATLTIDAGTVNRSMDTTIGTAQTVLQRASSNATDVFCYIAKFISDPLNQTSIAANTWTYNFAYRVQNLNNQTGPVKEGATNPKYSNLPLTCYVWRPSTGAKVANIIDADSAGTSGEYFDCTKVQNDNTQILCEEGTFSGSAVTCQVGDVIVLEAWVYSTDATVRTNAINYYFDGTTVTTAGETVVTNHASFLETPQTVAFVTGGGGATVTKSLFRTVTVSAPAPTATVSSDRPGTKMMITTGAFTSRTTTGTDVISGVGFQPKVVILWSTAKGSSDEVMAAHFGLRFGVAVDTTTANQRSFEQFSSDNQGTSVTEAGWNNAIHSTVSADLIGILSALGSDGFTVNWTVSDGAASHINYCCIGGTDITNTKCGAFTGPTSTGSQATTGIGFKPDFVMFFGMDTNADNSVNGTNVNWGIGFGINATSPAFKQACLCTVSKEAQGTSSCKNYQRGDNNSCYALLSSATTTNKALEGSLTSLDTDGWTINWTTVANTSRKIGYVAIKGGRYKISAVTSPTSGTVPVTQQTTGFGFFPAGILALTTNNTAGTTVVADNKISFGAGSASSDVRCGFSGDLDAKDTTSTMREHRATKVAMVASISATETSSTVLAEAGITSMDADGVTLSWSAHDTNAYQMIVVGFGSSARVLQNITKTSSSTLHIIATPPARLEGHTRTLTRPITVVASTPTRIEGHNRSLTRPITVVATIPARIEGHIRSLTRPILISATAPTRLKSKNRIPQEPPVRIIANTPTKLLSKVRTLSRPILIIAPLTRLLTKQRSLSRPITVSHLNQPNIPRIANKIRATPSATVSIKAATLTKLKGKVKSLTRIVHIVATQTKTVAKRKTALLSATVLTPGTQIRRVGISRAASQTILIVSSIPTRLASRARVSTLTQTVLVKSAVLNRLATKNRTLFRSGLIFATTPTRLKTRTLNTIAQFIQITVSLPIRTASRSRIRTFSQSVFVSHIPLARILQKKKTFAQTLHISTLNTRLKVRRLQSVTQTLTITQQNVTYLRARLRTLSGIITVSSLPITVSRTKKRALLRIMTVVGPLAKITGKRRSLQTQSVTSVEGVDTDAVKAGERSIQKTLTSVLRVVQITGRRTANKWRRIGS